MPKYRLATPLQRNQHCVGLALRPDSGTSLFHGLHGIFDLVKSTLRGPSCDVVVILVAKHLSTTNLLRKHKELTRHFVGVGQNCATLYSNQSELEARRLIPQSFNPHSQVALVNHGVQVTRQHPTTAMISFGLLDFTQLILNNIEQHAQQLSGRCILQLTLEVVCVESSSELASKNVADNTKVVENHGDWRRPTISEHF